jgi:predicted RNase H-like HicB family nuclease
MNYQLLIIVEEGHGNRSAYSPDVPGCVAIGNSREEVEHNIYEALQGHLRWMLEDGDEMPSGPSFALYVSITQQHGNQTKMYRVLTIIREEDNGYVIYAADTEDKLGWGATLKEAEQIASEAVKGFSVERLDESTVFPSYEVYMTLPVEAREQAVIGLFSLLYAPFAIMVT